MIPRGYTERSRKLENIVSSEIVLDKTVWNYIEDFSGFMWRRITIYVYEPRSK